MDLCVVASSCCIVSHVTYSLYQQSCCKQPVQATRLKFFESAKLVPEGRWGGQEKKEKRKWDILWCWGSLHSALAHFWCHTMPCCCCGFFLLLLRFVIIFFRRHFSFYLSPPLPCFFFPPVSPLFSPLSYQFIPPVRSTISAPASTHSCVNPVRMEAGRRRKKGD